MQVPPAAGMAAALGHSQQKSCPKGQAPVLASKPFPNNPGTREIRKKLGEIYSWNCRRLGDSVKRAEAAAWGLLGRAGHGELLEV